MEGGGLEGGGGGEMGEGRSSADGKKKKNHQVPVSGFAQAPTVICIIMSCQSSSARATGFCKWPQSGNSSRSICLCVHNFIVIPVGLGCSEM